jgi:hydrophobic/amphiphilic exporter-1 (mainly G- bacteria), HAE1 family
MKLPRFSVKRPIFTTMVTLILVILGAVSLSRLQIDMLPNIELPTLTSGRITRVPVPRSWSDW